MEMSRRPGAFGGGSAIVAPLAVAAACGGVGEEAPGIVLENGSGKHDTAAVRLHLTDASPTASLAVSCDRKPGCGGFFSAAVYSPDACELLGGEPPACGEGGMDPASIELATVTIESATEGTRELPLDVSTDDGEFFSISIAAGFSVDAGQDVTFLLEKHDDAPEFSVRLGAHWDVEHRPGHVEELEQFLSTVEGLRFEETSTTYPGYRAYEIWYEQPLDHQDGAVSFTQRMVLHHRDIDRPTVLYTTGYGLADDYVSELSEGLGGNQLTTEQRFFGSSIVEDVQPEDWEHVTVRQAAADHHRIVSALRDFYSGSWISTGHSKGGMTSIYHRRFYPDDVDATVAYVAPISFDLPDPGYVPFLDQIGEDDCRENLRNVQREAIARIDALEAIGEKRAAEEDWEFDGIDRSRLEWGAAWLEWIFWQYEGVRDCPDIPAPDELEDDVLYDLVSGYLGGLPSAGASPGEANPGKTTYTYQAHRELGYQTVATEHLADLLERDVQFEVGSDRLLPPDVPPPTYSPDSMHDVQDWVLEDGNQILFIYGEYDPWTGGAFATAPDTEVLTVYAPKASHSARIRDLSNSDRDAALDAIARWTGARPEIDSTTRPTGAPTPPGLYEGMPLRPGWRH